MAVDSLTPGQVSSSSSPQQSALRHLEWTGCRNPQPGSSCLSEWFRTAGMENNTSQAYLILQWKKIKFSSHNLDEFRGYSFK